MRERLAAVVLASFLPASSGFAQEGVRPTEAEVREVLETSALENVLASLGEQVVAALEQTAPSLGDEATERVRSAVVEAFAPERLYREVVASIRSRSDQGQLEELRAWLLSDSQRHIQAKSAAEAMDETLEQYAQRIQTSPPPQERIQLVARYVQAQQAGEFYMLLEERLRTAARRLAEQVGGSEAVVEQDRSEEDQARELQQARIFSLISFLHRMEPLSDAEAQELVEAYESPSGQWYVEAYTEALLAAIDAATDVALAKIGT